MRVERKNKAVSVRVGDLEEGETFGWQDQVHVILDEKDGAGVIMSAELHSGTICRWNADAHVTPINAKVVIE